MLKTRINKKIWWDYYIFNDAINLYIISEKIKGREIDFLKINPNILKKDYNSIHYYMRLYYNADNK